MTGNQGELTVQEMGKRLSDCADYLRGHVDPAEYKDYILPLVFYAEVNRRFYETYKEEKEKANLGEDPDEEIEETVREIAAEETVQNIEIPQQFSWEDIVDHQHNTEDGQNIVPFISEALEQFEDLNNESYGFTEMFDPSPFADESGNTAISNVVDVIDQNIYTQEKDVSPDLLGEAFMFLLKEFAREEAGEYFTPPRVVRLVVELVEPFSHASSIHDPTVGSGGMLTEASNQILARRDSGWYEENYPEGFEETDSDKEFLDYNGFTFSGQELNPRIVSIAKMNMAINNLSGDIKRGDSLTHPQFTDGKNKLQKFDYILANFPFSEGGWKSDTKKRAERYGDLDWTDSLPHGSYGDFAFIMHMESQLADDGKLATIIPDGVLTRNGDKEYREYMIENDLVEAVISLPDNLFEGTKTSTSILVLNKDKPEQREREIMFFNANQEGKFYRDTGSDRDILIDPIEDGEDVTVADYDNLEDPQGTAEIKQFFSEWREEERVSRIVSMEDISNRDYNMNLSLYVDTTEPQKDIDVQDTLANIRNIEQEYQQLNQQFTQYMQQLNYEGDN